MKLYWLEQREADLPTEDDWLSPCETARLDKFRFAKRRTDWRLGRWTAKQAVAFCLNLRCDLRALAAIEIRPASSGAPEVFVSHTPAAVAISLSHREGRAMCAIAAPNVRVGCDLEAIEPRSDAFIADYLTHEEQQLVARSSSDNRQLMVSLLWSAKESALKALHEGLRLDTRTVTASCDCESLNSEGWVSLEVRYGCETFMGWWQQTDHLVRTILADVASDAPICLPVGNCCASEFAA